MSQKEIFANEVLTLLETAGLSNYDRVELLYKLAEKRLLGYFDSKTGEFVAYD